MDFELRGKKALVTGASGNLGSAIATVLAMQGVSVGLFYGSRNSGEATQRLAQRLSCLDFVVAIALHGDVRSEDSLNDSIAAFLAHFGQMDILVNNAGIFTSSSQENLPEEDWDAVMDINVKGIWRMCRLSFPHLIQSRGTVVNICSINAFRPGFGGTAHYDASKGAVAAYTRSLAAEYAPYGVRVNAVAPGLIDAVRLRDDAPDLVGHYKNRAALKRLVAPEDIAQVVAFLASDASRAMTGEIVAADCGYGMM